MAPQPLRTIGEVSVQQLGDQLPHTGAVVPLGHEIGLFLDRGQRVRDSNRSFTMVQEGVIVFSVADADGIER